MLAQESQPEASLIPPLDDSLLSLSETETTFLHATISSNDEELKERILDVQKKAYAHYPYPCFRGFHHVNLMMSRNAVYTDVLTAGKTGNTILLDLGCCMGTDVRKLVFDGYAASKIVGCDLRQDFIDLGYELFGDRDASTIRFFTDNIFSVSLTSHDPTTPPVELSQVTTLAQLQGRVDHFYLGALFHLFDEPIQYSIALAVGTLLRREKGSIVFGRHQGLEKEGVVDDHLGRNRFAHSPASWADMWKRVFTQLDSEAFAESRVVVDALLDDGFAKEVFRTEKPSKMLYWSVKIV